MKLNYKRTIFVGFAFFLIMAFWQAYEAIVPLMLVNKFGLNQTFSGFVMALDNILAVFMLPLFGSLSDKTNTKYGKRTPYILVGTIVSIVAFVGLTFADNAQLQQIHAGDDPVAFQQILWEENSVINNAENQSSCNAQGIDLHDYVAKIKFDEKFKNLTEEQREEARVWFINLNSKSVYYYNHTSGEYLLDDGQTDLSGAVKCDAYSNLVSTASSNYAWKTTASNPVPLIVFAVILLIVLLAMAVFRSPAVALMPDVTIKPLRSQGNAVINLMGTFGAMLVLGLGIIFGTGAVENQTKSFTGYVIAVCAIMLFGLIMFLTCVREPKWAKEMQEESERLGLDVESDEIEDLVDSEVKSTDGANDEGAGGIKDLVKHNKGKFISLLLILASVALWYVGYNAASSKYSLYATNVLHKDYNLTLLIAQGAAIISYVPAGILAAKIGRKKSILSGVALLTVAFATVATFNANTPTMLINVVFALGGIGWATINVNSFPMVVELAKGNDVGKYTGYYYTASMLAQIITPLLSGAVMDIFGSMRPLFWYSTVFIAMSFVTMLFVRHGDNLKLKEQADEAKKEAVSFEE